MPSAHGGETISTDPRTFSKATVKRLALVQKHQDAYFYKTLKQDGTQITFDVQNDVLHFASRSFGYLTTEQHLIQFHNRLDQEDEIKRVRAQVLEMAKHTSGRLIVRGEAFGTRIGNIKSTYTIPLKFQVFEIVIDGKSQCYPEMLTLCAQFNIEIVPLLAEGVLKMLHVLNPQPFPHDDIKGFAEGAMLTSYEIGTDPLRIKLRHEQAWQRTRAKQSRTYKEKKRNVPELVCKLETFHNFLSYDVLLNVFSHNGIKIPSNGDVVNMAYVGPLMHDITLSKDIEGSESWSKKDIAKFKSQAKYYIPFIQTIIDNRLS